MPSRITITFTKAPSNNDFIQFDVKSLIPGNNSRQTLKETFINGNRNGPGKIKIIADTGNINIHDEHTLEYAKYFNIDYNQNAAYSIVTVDGTNQMFIEGLNNENIGFDNFSSNMATHVIENINYEPFILNSALYEEVSVANQNKCNLFDLRL